MEELIKILEREYERFSELYARLTVDKEDIDKKINSLIDTFDQVELFDENDINEICDALDTSLALEFRKSSTYFKMVKKCPNQPQIVQTIELLKRVTEQLYAKLMEENKDVFDLYDEYTKKLETYKKSIELLKGYTKDTYISSNDLYNIVTLISKSDINENIINLFLQILSNNNLLSSEDKGNSNITKSYNEFITRITNINKSMSFDSFEDDKKIVRYLEYIVDEEYDTLISNDILDLIKHDIDEEDIIKRVRFIFHLHNVEVKLTAEQLKFLSSIISFYEERLNDANNNKVSASNHELLGLLDDDYKFTNIDLLKQVFRNNEVEPQLQLIIICAIINNNSNKRIENTKIEVLSSKELFKKYNLDTTFICEEDYQVLDESIERVNEVFNILIERAPKFINKLFDEIGGFDVLSSILTLSSSVIINKIIKICNEEEIDFESFISNCPNILISNGTSNVNYGSYDSFIENIEFCKKNNLSIKELQNVLGIDNKILVGRFNIFTRLYNIDVVGNEYLLCEPYILNSLDKIIETGKNGLKFIRDNISYLKQDCTKIVLSLYASQELIIVENDRYILDPKKIDLVLDHIDRKYPYGVDVTPTKTCWTDKFAYYEGFFPTCTIDDYRVRRYIPENYDYINEELFNIYYIKELESSKNKIKKNEFTYVINGTYVSRIKFLRVCTYLYDILKQNNEPFDLPAIKFALRFESLLIGTEEKNIDNFMMMTAPKNKPIKTKKKKK